MTWVLMKQSNMLSNSGLNTLGMFLVFPLVLIHFHVKLETQVQLPILV
ncbi:hypothetical protein CUMW_231550 [Citrus unshiu]|uniref:Uncharacterized protein n=1 Tax=Citrus unshiu TaxID=55188 RepID=A0A2H5QHV6_CITUN|nr:hypothetical protein CUMW_231550 [Citrus unshiu]